MTDLRDDMVTEILEAMDSALNAAKIARALFHEAKFEKRLRAIAEQLDDIANEIGLDLVGLED